MMVPRRTIATLVVFLALGASAEARSPRDRRPSVAPTPVAPANVHLAPAGEIALPGRGLALAWAPDASGIATGGHFKDPTTGQRYDTRVVDVASQTLRPAG